MRKWDLLDFASNFYMHFKSFLRHSHLFPFKVFYLNFQLIMQFISAIINVMKKVEIQTNSIIWNKENIEFYLTNFHINITALLWGQFQEWFWLCITTK